MKQKRLTIIAVGCGLACAVCIALFMASVQGEANAARAEALARYGGEQVEVCVATRDVTAGEKIDMSAMEKRLWIADLLPDGAVREPSDVSGKMATSSILKSEVVSSKRFESSHSVLDIPAGKEALSVPAKAVQAVGGAVRPGMAVDIYSSGDTTTKPLAHDVIVLDTSVGNSGSLVSGDAGWITLAIESEHVQEIIAASNATSLYFVIPGDPAQPEVASGQAESVQPEAPEGASQASAPAPEGASQASEPSSQSAAQDSQASSQGAEPSSEAAEAEEEEE